jgi:NAD(P)-dependent dehydrogenase (short-subunit alcohol dehydrogenase family)
MVEAGHGTIQLTGASASLRGKARFSALAVGKFGLRALGQSMAREFGPQGIHVPRHHRRPDRHTRYPYDDA